LSKNRFSFKAFWARTTLIKKNTKQKSKKEISEKNTDLVLREFIFSVMNKANFWLQQTTKVPLQLCQRSCGVMRN